ncbi:hypothetical protein HK100_005812 [Physocladia obscura]|uniref:ABC1 atypical kinase-like domain-containing protein n=1 Tax=Physocladia obscura TaxID=109957 RepID=A0AAD5TC53_9FUNG|nr:hypothetical protein HK100_005812 [Physocladia obscura]
MRRIIGIFATQNRPFPFTLRHPFIRIRTRTQTVVSGIGFGLGFGLSASVAISALSGKFKPENLLNCENYVAAASDDLVLAKECVLLAGSVESTKLWKPVGVFVWLLFGNRHKLLITTESIGDERDWFLNLATKTFSTAGPIFIKLCQWASMRQDLFHPSVCAAFSHLQSHSPRHSFPETVVQVEKMLNDPDSGFLLLRTGKNNNASKSKALKISDVFERFDETPVGVGAVAQVHRAKIRPQYFSADERNHANTDVAVKVLHPNISTLIEMDLILAQGFGRIIAYLVPGSKYLAINEEIETFARMMRKQMDLRVEFENLVQFRRNFLESEVSGEKALPISFPKPLFRKHQSILIEEYCAGVPFSLITELGTCAYDEDLILIGLPAFIVELMIMKHNFVHADLHAGNILLAFKNGQDWASEQTYESLKKSGNRSPNSKTTVAITQKNRQEILKDLKNNGYLPHLIFLDVGLTGQLSSNNLENMRLLLAAALDGNGEKMADLFMTRCRDPSVVVDASGARQKMKKMIGDLGLHHGHNTGAVLPLSKLKSGEVLKKAADFFREHRIGLEGDWIGLFVAAVLVEGIARSMGGDVDILEVLVDEIPDGFNF